MNKKIATPEVKKTSYTANTRPVYCGEWTQAERKLLNKLTTEERHDALLEAAKAKKPAKK